MRRGSLWRGSGPNYVYIKYRCTRCKKVGEHFIKQHQWSDSLLADNTRGDGG